VLSYETRYFTKLGFEIEFKYIGIELNPDTNNNIVSESFDCDGWDTRFFVEVAHHLEIQTKNPRIVNNLNEHDFLEMMTSIKLWDCINTKMKDLISIEYKSELWHGEIKKFHFIKPKNFNEVFLLQPTTIQVTVDVPINLFMNFLEDNYQMIYQIMKVDKLFTTMNIKEQFTIAQLICNFHIRRHKSSKTDSAANDICFKSLNYRLSQKPHPEVMKYIGKWKETTKHHGMISRIERTLSDTLAMIMKPVKVNIKDGDTIVFEIRQFYCYLGDNILSKQDCIRPFVKIIRYDVDEIDMWINSEFEDDIENRGVEVDKVGQNIMKAIKSEELNQEDPDEIDKIMKLV